MLSFGVSMLIREALKCHKLYRICTGRTGNAVLAGWLQWSIVWCCFIFRVLGFVNRTLLAGANGWFWGVLVLTMRVCVGVCVLAILSGRNNIHFPIRFLQQILLDSKALMREAFSSFDGSWFRFAYLQAIYSIKHLITRSWLCRFNIEAFLSKPMRKPPNHFLSDKATIKVTGIVIKGQVEREEHNRSILLEYSFIWFSQRLKIVFESDSPDLWSWASVLNRILGGQLKFELGILGIRLWFPQDIQAQWKLKENEKFEWITFSEKHWSSIRWIGDVIVWSPNGLHALAFECWSWNSSSSSKCRFERCYHHSSAIKLISRIAEKAEIKENFRSFWLWVWTTICVSFCRTLLSLEWWFWRNFWVELFKGQSGNERFCGLPRSASVSLFETTGMTAKKWESP